MSDHISGVECEQWSDVPQCPYVIIAASDHFSDVTVHRQCRVKRDAKKFHGVTEWYDCTSNVDATRC